MPRGEKFMRMNIGHMNISALSGIGKEDIRGGNHSHPLIINPSYSSLFVDIEKGYNFVACEK